MRPTFVRISLKRDGFEFNYLNNNNNDNKPSLTDNIIRLIETLKK